MDEDAELTRIVRREVSERVDRILRAVGAPPAATPWDQVYRDAHTLAGIAPEIDPEVAREARRLTEILLDARGRPRAPQAGEDEAEARRVARRLTGRAGDEGPHA